MPIEQYTYWSMTINNPEETDYVLVRNPNQKYIRELVWTPEVGAEGTQHIQAWLRLQRNQTMNFVKKLYPRAHLKHCDKDMYNENCHQYAQKNDETTAGNHHIVLNDPLPANDTLLYKVLDESYDRLIQRDSILKDLHEHEGVRDVIQRITLKQLWTDIVEREMVMEKSGLEKIFISPAYEKMKARYWREIILRLKYKQDDVLENQSGRETCEEIEEGSDSDSYEEGSSGTDEGCSEGSSFESDAEDD